MQVNISKTETFRDNLDFFIWFSKHCDIYCKVKDISFTVYRVTSSLKSSDKTTRLVFASFKIVNDPSVES